LISCSENVRSLPDTFVRGALTAELDM